MNSENAAYQLGSISRTLLIVFIVLKLTKLINWSWWWVLSPVLIPITVAFALAVVMIAVEHDNIR